MRADFDFAVIGSGAGGACAAAALARGGARVLLAEKGGDPPAARDPLDCLRLRYAQGGAVAAVGGGLLPIPTGQGLGGTTAINSGTCLRTPAALLKAWEERLGGAFDAGEFGERLDEAWAALGVRRAPEATMSRSSRLALAGAARLDLPGGATLQRAERGCKGAGRCCFGCPNDAKTSSADAFLRPPPPGLELRLLTRLRAVEPGGPGPARVTLEGPRGRERLSCGALILAAGALATPYFVRRFRLGRAWRAAGDGLSVHPAAKVYARLDEPASPGAGVPQGAGFEDPDDEAIRYEGVALPRPLAALAMPLEGRELRWWRDRHEETASFGFMVRDQARGRVRYPLGPGLPWIRYRLAPADRARMLAAARRLARVFLAAGARRVLLPYAAPGAQVDDPSGLDAFEPGDAPLQAMAFHPLGTCGMGRVVGADLALAPRVFVCDGSVVPDSLGVNPQVTIYAFALRLARALLKNR